MNNMLLRLAGRWLLERLGEASTWNAIALYIAGQLALLAHVELKTGFANLFVQAGLAITALLGFIIQDGWQIKDKS
jgi:hypothetical protein